MTWKTTINSISDPPFPSDNKVLSVLFSRDDGSGAFTREFKLAAGNFKTADDVTSFLADRVADLTALDGVVADLSPLVGQEITTGDGLPERVGTIERITAAVSAQLGLSVEQSGAAVAAAVDLAAGVKVSR